MIERYSREKIKAIWSDGNKFRLWLKIELAATYARVELGQVDRNIYNKIVKKANFDTKRILEIEEEVKHDVIAFLTNVNEFVGEEGKILHYGMTSSDVLDTCLSLQIIEASKILIKDIEELLNSLKEKAIKYKKVIAMGRTHGVHAEPITFGLKFVLWYDEMKRNLTRLKKAKENISIGKISGAVGTYQHLDPKVEEIVCRKLGLKPANISTQIIQRDVHADYLNTLALIASSLEKIATELRHLQRTEVLEVEEPFSYGQKGSSAMPHKKNPILAERICGLARIIRANSIVGMENITLWHERDISHSSAERVIFPDSTIALDYILDKMNFIIKNLKVNENRIKKNIELSKGLISSQKLLLKLVKKGYSREDAYSIVQKFALQVWESNITLKEKVSKDQNLKKLFSKKEIEEIFSLNGVLKNIEHIYDRVGLK